MKHDLLRFTDKINEYNELGKSGGIGTLGERCLHSIIKNYYESDTTKHETKVCGYIADILNDDGIIEIQTNNFSSLKRKLEKYLDEYKVKIVYPVSHIKHIVWIDPDTGEAVKRNKSPKTGTGAELLYEASRISDFLGHPNLNFDILLIDMDEYRLLNGWSCDRKKGSVRCDRKPLLLYDVIEINNKNDLNKILPFELTSEEFTFASFSKALKLKGRTAAYSLNTLFKYGYIKKVGKRGNAYIYKKI